MSDIEANDESVVITENIEVQVELTPKRVAEIFWAMGEDQQAQFFNALGGESTSLLSEQLVALCGSKVLNADGREVLDILADAINGRM